MNTTLPNIILRYPPLIHEKIFSKEQIEKFRIDQSDAKKESIPTYDLIYNKTSELECPLVIQVSVIHKLRKNNDIRKS